MSLRVLYGLTVSISITDQTKDLYLYKDFLPISSRHRKLKEKSINFSNVGRTTEAVWHRVFYAGKVMENRVSLLTVRPLQKSNMTTTVVTD